MKKSKILRTIFISLLLIHIGLLVYYFVVGRFNTLSFDDGSTNLLIILSSAIIMYLGFIVHFHLEIKSLEKEIDHS